MNELKKNVFIRVKLDDDQNIVHFDFLDKNGEKIIEKTDDNDRIFEKINTNVESKLDSKYIIVSADVTETIDDDGNYNYEIININKMQNYQLINFVSDNATLFDTIQIKYNEFRTQYTSMINNPIKQTQKGSQDESEYGTLTSYLQKINSAIENHILKFREYLKNPKIEDDKYYKYNTILQNYEQMKKIQCAELPAFKKYEVCNYNEIIKLFKDYNEIILPTFLEILNNYKKKSKPDIKDDLAPGFYILDDMLTQQVLEEKEDDLKTPEEKKQSSFRQFFEKIYNSLNLIGWIRNRNNKNPDKKINIPSDLLFENNKEIGKGKFASVELWEDKTNQQNKYAVKILNYGEEQTKNTLVDIKKEIYILQKLKESNKNRCIYNILCFKGAYHDIKNEIVYIATEYDENYNALDTVLNNAKIIEQNAVIKILSLLFEAILDFHALNICHNDIKPDNILCSKNIAEIPKINIKVIDFGFACLKDDTYAKCDVTKILGTYEYIDPSKEYYNIPDVTPKDNYNQNYIKCDYWSVGIIFKNFIDKAELNFEINKTENFRNRFGKIFYLYYKTIIGKRMLDTEDENEDENEDEKEDESDMIIVNEFKDIFNQLIPISDKWFDYAIENEMTFARIEDLLDPDLSQRYIFTEEDMRILKAAKTTKITELDNLVESIYNYDSDSLKTKIKKDENRKAKLELEITRITNKIV